MDPFGEQAGIFQMGPNVVSLTGFVLTENAKNSVVQQPEAENQLIQSEVEVLYQPEVVVQPEPEVQQLTQYTNWTQTAACQRLFEKIGHGQIGKNCQIVSSPVWFLVLASD